MSLEKDNRRLMALPFLLIMSSILFGSRHIQKINPWRSCKNAPRVKPPITSCYGLSCNTSRRGFFRMEKSQSYFRVRVQIYCVFFFHHFCFQVLSIRFVPKVSQVFFNNGGYFGSPRLVTLPSIVTDCLICGLP